MNNRLQGQAGGGGAGQVSQGVGIIDRLATGFADFVDTYAKIEYVVPFVIVCLIVWILFKVLHRLLIYSRRLWRAMGKVLYEVTLPASAVGGGVGRIANAEQFFTGLHGFFKFNAGTFLFGQEHFSFEIVYRNGLIVFYFAVPRKMAATVKKQINAHYPEAAVEPVSEYDIFRPGYKVAVAQYKLAQSYVFPIKSYYQQTADPLEEITNAFDQMGRDEGAAIQVMIQPVSSGWHREGNNLLRRVKRGKGLSTSGRLVTMLWDGVRGIYEVFRPMAPHELTEEEMKAASAVHAKIDKDGFRVAIRLLASAKNKADANKRLADVTATMKQFDFPGVNRVEQKGVWLRDKFIADFIFRFYPILGRIFILNTEELATLCHFPDTGLSTPRIKYMEARTSLAPDNIPGEGITLGVNVFRGTKKPVRILPEDRLRHMYIIGKTGMGKSTLISNLALRDIYNGEGTAVVDPHGDLIEQILRHIPRERAEDVVLFDPSDIEYPIGLNLLEVETPEQTNVVVSEAIDIFYKLFYQFAGPDFDHIMRNAISTLMASGQGATLVDIAYLFASNEYAARRAAELKNPLARAFWTEEMAAMSPAEKAQRIGPVIEKIESFAGDDILRNVLGQVHSGFSIERIMNEGKILLVNLSKGKIGELNSALLGLIITTKFYMSTMTRAQMTEEARKPFYLYVDEFQNFTTDKVATIFSEARKYKLSLAVSHQYIGQLTQNIAKAVFGNVGTLINFRVGTEDAGFLEPEFSPPFTGFDLVNLPKYTTYTKLMVQGKATSPFSMKTLPPPTQDDPGAPTIIKEFSRRAYGRPKAEVEAEIAGRFS